MDCTPSILSEMLLLALDPGPEPAHRQSEHEFTLFQDAAKNPTAALQTNDRRDGTHGTAMHDTHPNPPLACTALGRRAGRPAAARAPGTLLAPQREAAAVAALLLSRRPAGCCTSSTAAGLRRHLVPNLHVFATVGSAGQQANGRMERGSVRLAPAEIWPLAAAGALSCCHWHLASWQMER